MVLRLRYPAPDGWKDAKCRDYSLSHSEDPFFSEEEEEIEEALSFCNGISDGKICPIRQECLLFALVNNEKYGVWGGTTYGTRKAMRRKYPPIKGAIPREEWIWKKENEWLSNPGKEQLPSEEDAD